MPCGLVRDGTSSTTSPSRWSVSPGRTGFIQRRSSTPAPKSGCGQGADLNREVHGDGSRVPSRSSEPFEGRVLGGRFVHVERLRIEFGREPLDVFFGDRHLTALEAHPYLQVIEPFHHCALS